MVARSLCNVLRVFQVFGVFPVSIDKISNKFIPNWKSLFFAIIRLIITFLVISYQIILNHKSIPYAQPTFMESFLSMTRFVSERFIIIIISFELILKRFEIIEFFDGLNQFDQFILNNFHKKLSNQTKKHIFFKMIFVVCYTSGMVLYAYWHNVLTFVENFMDFFVLLEYFQSDIFIRLIEDRIHLINECITKVKEIPRKKSFEITLIGSHIARSNQLVLDMRESFSMIWRATQSLNHILHYTLPGLIAFSFGQILYGIYSVFVSIMYKRNDIDIYYCSVITVTGLLMIYFLTSSASDVIELVCFFLR